MWPCICCVLMKNVSFGIIILFLNDVNVVSPCDPNSLVLSHNLSLTLCVKLLFRGGVSHCSTVPYPVQGILVIITPENLYLPRTFIYLGRHTLPLQIASMILDCRHLMVDNTHLVSPAKQVVHQILGLGVADPLDIWSEGSPLILWSWPGGTEVVCSEVWNACWWWYWSIPNQCNSDLPHLVVISMLVPFSCADNVSCLPHQVDCVGYVCGQGYPVIREKLHWH